MNRAILRIALPAIISNITTPLLGLIDVAIVGHIGNATYIAAIAVGGAMFNMLYWLFTFLRMGTGGLTAQSYGANDVPQGRRVSDESTLILYRGLLVGVLVGVLMIALSVPLADLVLGFMDADASTGALARRYFMIGIWGAPAVLATYTLAGWFIGMQNTRAMMVVAIVTDVVNILVSLILVFVFHLDIEGVATGTVVAQWTGFIIGGVIVWAHYRCRHMPWKLILHRGAFRRFFAVNIDIFFRTVGLVAVTMWFTHAGAVQGPVMLAVNALLMQLFLLLSYFMDGFAFAGEALAGRFLGAGDHPNLHRSIKATFRWGLGVALAFTALYFIGGEAFLSFLTDDTAVRISAHEYFLWAVTIPIAGYAAFIWDGIYIGMTMTRRMLMAMIAAVATFFGLYVALFPSMGNHGLWLAFIAYLAVRGLMQWGLFRIPRHATIAHVEKKS